MMQVSVEPFPTELVRFFERSSGDVDFSGGKPPAQSEGSQNERCN